MSTRFSEPSLSTVSARVHKAVYAIGNGKPFSNEDKPMHYLLLTFSSVVAFPGLGNYENHYSPGDVAGCFANHGEGGIILINLWLSLRFRL